jgi:hypothetical protein
VVVAGDVAAPEAVSWVLSSVLVVLVSTVMILLLLLLVLLLLRRWSPGPSEKHGSPPS